MITTFIHALYPILSADDFQQLHVTIPHSGPVSAPLGSSISIPCLVSPSSIPASSSSSPVALRVKWTVVSDGVKTEILVARGEKVKINEAYRDRAASLNYTSSDDLSLWLGDLRSSDSGHYRCEVQQGLEAASDVVQLKVKGNEIKKMWDILKRSNRIINGRISAGTKTKCIYSCSRTLNSCCYSILMHDYYTVAVIAKFLHKEGKYTVCKSLYKVTFIIIIIIFMFPYVLGEYMLKPSLLGTKG